MTEPTRREALGLATTAAAFAAAGRLPTLAAPNPVPVGLSPVRGHLGDHSLAKGPAKASLLRYAVLRWRNTDPSTGDTTNQEIGTLELKIERSSEEVRVGRGPRRRATPAPRIASRPGSHAVRTTFSRCEAGRSTV